MRRSLADDLRTAWRIVLRAQFHDVITGTAIPAVYADVHADYDRADAIAARVVEAARSVLPRSDLRLVAPPPLAPRRDGDGWLFENAYVRARVRDDGTIVELGAAGGPSVVALANGIAAYVDKPKRWDAWNVDASYPRKRVAVKPQGAAVEDDGLVVRLAVGKNSRISMRLALHEDEPWLRVEHAVAWHEDHVLLRAEHRLALRAREVRYGQQHGTLVRTRVPDRRRRADEVRGARAALGARDRRRERPGRVRDRPLRLERRRPQGRRRAPGHLAAARADLARSRCATAASSGWRTRSCRPPARRSRRSSRPGRPTPRTSACGCSPATTRRC